MSNEFDAKTQKMKFWAVDKKELHTYHRQRMKENFRKCGFQGFQAHNIIELLLFYSIPRCDTNETAHLLINEFGSLSGVFDAPIEALVNVDGVGIESATLIKIIPEIFRAYEESKFCDKTVILSSDDASNFLASYFKTATYEKLVILYLDGGGRLIKDAEITQGNTDMIFADLNSVIKSAILLNAKGIVIAHNHVNGFAVPSAEDKALTEKLAKMCAPVGIHLCDHILFGGKDVCSFSKRKVIKSDYLAF